MSKQVMQRALDALTGVLDDDKDVRKASITGGLYEVVDCRQAIAELRAAIDAPEVEPVGYTNADGLKYVDAHFVKIAKCFPPGEWIAVYAAPPDTEAMRRDAERYRWLRDQNADLEAGFYVGNETDALPEDITWVGCDLDAVIDAAIAAQGGTT